jgi:hypothetical protein
MTYRQYDESAALRLDEALSRGERRLMLATLEDGIRTILSARHRRVPHRRVKADLDWLTDDDPRPAFGFISLCDFLGIDAQYLRARALAAHSMGPYAATFPVHVKREDRRGAPVS